MGRTCFVRCGMDGDGVTMIGGCPLMGQQADDGKGRGGFVTTFCGMSAGGDELFWRGVSDTSHQFGRGVFAAGGW